MELLEPGEILFTAKLWTWQLPNKWTSMWSKYETSSYLNYLSKAEHDNYPTSGLVGGPICVDFREG